MIKCKNGKVAIKGTEDQLIADIGCICESVYKALGKVNGKDKVKRMILSVTDFAMLEKEEREAKLIEAMKEAADFLSEEIKNRKEEDEE